MATEVVKQAAERAHQQGRRETNLIRIKEVSASRGKVMRAEPVSLLYEKQRVLHRRGLDQLEAEMMAFSREWDRSVDGSPNRLDAMIWGEQEREVSSSIQEIERDHDGGWDWRGGGWGPGVAAGFVGDAVIAGDIFVLM